ncbi:hypothetical protein L2E82_39193 [Cichorium intybus]|uniref:Uncharacterized protein n=1 Tax=Cichorium intybus TaxID=13427 RepID=A0ACB9AHI7_CICIN|nr:hypothetical protein L2E82_39193 [Cichorium intybus]
MKVTGTTAVNDGDALVVDGGIALPVGDCSKVDGGVAMVDDGDTEGVNWGVVAAFSFSEVSIFGLREFEIGGGLRW